MKLIDGDTVRRVANYPLIIEAIREGHQRKKAIISDSLLESAGRKLLVRSAWIEGLGIGVKAMSVYPDNPRRSPPIPSIQGQVLLYDDDSGSVVAAVDGEEVTKWKTASDSALGSDLLARPDCETMLMVGAGTMAEPLIRGHVSVRPSLNKLLIWNRTVSRAEALADAVADLGLDIRIVSDLEASVGSADILCSATMSQNPVISGRHLRPGCHVDLIGAYTPAMREADDDVLRRGRIFVDSYDSTVDHIGELKIPIAEGTISREDVLGDFYALVAGKVGRQSDEDITVFKNGGGAHLDVMTSQAIASAAVT